jgi:DNA-directed RNA polymerase subunit M/transcription elongation factor TFIIS
MIFAVGTSVFTWTVSGRATASWRSSSELISGCYRRTAGDTPGASPALLSRPGPSRRFLSMGLDLRVRAGRDDPVRFRTRRTALPRWGSRVRVPSSAPDSSCRSGSVSGRDVGVVGRFDPGTLCALQSPEWRADTAYMEQTEAETCPSCGSGKLALQGRVMDGDVIRELFCVQCKHSWRIELLPQKMLGRLRP